MKLLNPNNVLLCNMQLIQYHIQLEIQLHASSSFSKNQFGRSHSPSKWPSYPDVLKIKAIIVVKQKCHLTIKKNPQFRLWLYWGWDILIPGHRMARLWICGPFVYQQMAFLYLDSRQLLFLFSKHLDTMTNVTD